MGLLMEKFKEVTRSVLPIGIIIFLLHLTWAPLTMDSLIRCAIGTVLVILGLSLFHVGVEIGITPTGNYLGHVVTKYGKIIIVVLSGAVLGFIVAMAEPNLRIYGQQVEMLTNGMMTEMLIVYSVAIGVAAFIAMGLWRIVRSVSVRAVYIGFYVLVGVLCFLVPTEYIALSFDASGTTTGAMTVPFFLAIAAGVASFKSADSVASEEDSFGLVGLVSLGAIVGVLVVSVATGAESFVEHVELAEQASAGGLWESFKALVPQMLWEVLLTVLPVFFLFYAAHFLAEKVNKYELRRINMGFIYTYLGLVIFMTGVNYGFTRAGYEVGMQLGATENAWLLCFIGLIIGLVVILAEPAVGPLVHQIEDVTTGYVPRKLVLVFLSLAVGSSVCLSMLRIVVPGLELWHMLLPGYGLALILALVVPSLFVGIAFDSGCVASGPMAATFVFSFASGAAQTYPGADVFLDGSGVIALITMMPIVALQLLGLLFKARTRGKSS